MCYSFSYLRFLKKMGKSECYRESPMQGMYMGIQTCPALKWSVESLLYKKYYIIRMHFRTSIALQNWKAPLVPARFI